jgi:RimJ/RimL family protein N-acetyltransferase
MVRLEKFGEMDYDRLIHWIDSEKDMILFSGPIFTFPVTHAQLDEYVDAGNRQIYKVIDAISNEVIGHAELNNIDFAKGSARICRVLIGDPRNRNRGIGKAIIRELIRIAFDDLKLKRLELGVYDFNQSAIKCYEACGFEIEAFFRDKYKIGEEFWSTYQMCLINTL